MIIQKKETLKYKDFFTEEKNYNLKKIYPKKSATIDNIYIYQIRNLLKLINKKHTIKEKLYAEKVIFAAKKSIVSEKVEKV